MDLGGGATGVHVYEAASLGNLMPATADEAKSLIPSLKRFDDEDLTKMCNIVQRWPFPDQSARLGASPPRSCKICIYTSGRTSMPSLAFLG